MTRLAGFGVATLVRSELTARMGFDPPIEGVPAGRGRLALEARSWLGMSDVEDSDMATIKNRAITITGAYLW